jgi:hypothetical protein
MTTNPVSEPERADGFFVRWARRKAEQRRNEPVVAAAVAPPMLDALPAPNAVEPATPPTTEPAPTLDDVALLAPGAEVSRFIQPGVDAGVQRAALKKLFADPHFNVMDGLDVYIDDYGKPDPIPESMLRQMNQSKFLRLFEEDEKQQTQPQVPGAIAPSSEVEATAPVDGPAHPRPDEDPDLQLQPDDPDRWPGAPEEPR